MATKRGIVEPIDETGEWWLPEAPDRKLKGTLTVSLRGECELSLLGALRPIEADGESRSDGTTTTTTFGEESMERGGLYPRIYGIAGGREITLDDCFRTHRSWNLLGGPSIERIHVNRAFRGVWFDSEEVAAFVRISARMEWLAKWSMRSGIEESVEFTKSESGVSRPSRISISVSHCEEDTCDGVDGGTISLIHAYGVAGDMSVERRIWQDFAFSVQHPTLRPVAALLEEISDLQDLVSIGTGRVAAHTKVLLFHPEVVLERDGTTGQQLPIDMLAAWHPAPREGSSEKGLHPSQMFFTLADLGGLPGVQRWAATAEKHRSALSRVMATRYSQSMFVSDRVLNCAAALEAYDRDRHADERTFAERIGRCCALAGDPFARLVGDVEAWVQLLKNARNDVAHHNSRVGGDSTANLLLSDSAYWLFVLCLLVDSSASDVVFDHIEQHQQFHWLRRKFHELLSAPD